MKAYFYVDENGFIIDTPVYKEDGDEIELNCFKGWSQDQPFFNPKWDFSLGKWVENEPTADLLQMAKEEKELELNRNCSQEILSMFTAEVDGVTYYFSNDREAQSNFDKADRAFDKGRIAEIPWTAYDAVGEVVRLILNPANFEPVYMAHLGHIQYNISYFRDNLMAKVHAATNIEEVKAVVW